MRLIVGGDSKIGQSLTEFWRTARIRHHASTCRLSEVRDNRPYINLEELATQKFDVTYESVVYCAGVTSLSECRVNPYGTRRINVDGIAVLSEYFNKTATYQLYLSSSKVFDGTKPFWKIEDMVCPVTEYGRQKVETEKSILGFKHTSVLRMSKILFPGMALLQKWKDELVSGRPIHPYDNVNIAPLSPIEVVKKIDQLMRKKIIGLHHLSGKIDRTYTNLALEYAAKLDIDLTLVQPVSYTQKELCDDREVHCGFDSLEPTE